MKSKNLFHLGFVFFMVMAIVFLGVPESVKAQLWQPLPPYNLLWPLWSPAMTPIPDSLISPNIASLHTNVRSLNQFTQGMKSDFDQNFSSRIGVSNFGGYFSDNYAFVADMAVDYMSQYSAQQNKVYKAAGTSFELMVPGTNFMSSAGAFVGMTPRSMVPGGVFMSSTGMYTGPGSVFMDSGLVIGARSPSGLGSGLFDTYGNYMDSGVGGSRGLSGDMMGMPGPIMGMPNSNIGLMPSIQHITPVIPFNPSLPQPTLKGGPTTATPLRITN